MSTDRLSDSEMRADSEGSYLAAIEQMRMGGPENATAGHPATAARCVIVDAPGEPTALLLYGEDGALGRIVLGPADAIRIASDLLLSARRRYGRAQPEEN